MMVWAVTTQGQVLHYNGSKWTARQFPGAGGWPSGTFTGVTALSSTDVWVFGGAGIGGAVGGTAGPGAGGTLQYNGKTWKHWKTGNAVGLFWASAVSPSSIWAVGRLTSGSNGIVHFTGKTWQDVSAKALQGVSVSQIVALSDRNVWAQAWGSNLSVPVLVHYDGIRWARIAYPKGVWPNSLARLISDGHGGLWLVGDSTNKSYKPYLFHWSARGAWTTVNAAPAVVEGLTAIPGASGLWASGTLTPLSGAGSSAAVWAYGSV
jgi:hypothetical protein